MKRVPRIKQLENPLAAPFHDWLRFECTRCKGTYLGPPNPKGRGSCRS